MKNTRGIRVHRRLRRGGASRQLRRRGRRRTTNTSAPTVSRRPRHSLRPARPTTVVKGPHAMKVPFSDPSSLTRTLPPSSLSDAWRREMAGSLRGSSCDLPRTAGTGTTTPISGPSIQARCQDAPSALSAPQRPSHPLSGYSVRAGVSAWASSICHLDSCPSLMAPVCPDADRLIPAVWTVLWTRSPGKYDMWIDRGCGCVPAYGGAAPLIPIAGATMNP